MELFVRIYATAAHIADTLRHDTRHYGFEGGEAAAESFDWSRLKKAHDAYVKRLNGIYERGLSNLGVTVMHGEASFVDKHTVWYVAEGEDKCDGKKGNKVTAEKILVATGGRPHFQTGTGIEEHAISSDGFFKLDDLPKVAVVVGAGYIAVELAGFLRSLGSDQHL